MSYEHYSFDQQDEEGYYSNDDVVVRCADIPPPSH